jgi:hypothetical protein
MKIVGRQKTEPMSPAQCRQQALALQLHVDRVNPYPRPRGFVFKARTWEDYEAWRRRQENPRLW